MRGEEEVGEQLRGKECEVGKKLGMTRVRVIVRSCKEHRVNLA